MEPALSAVGALTLRLGKEHRSGVVTLYDLGVQLWQLYETREYAGHRIKNLRNPVPARSSLFKYRDELIENGVLEHRNDLPVDTWLLTLSPFKDPADILCGLDPFSYLSHLSAMEYHGLTDLVPRLIFATTYPAAEWRRHALNRMSTDLGDSLADYQTARLPPLQRHAFDAVGKRKLSLFASKAAGSFVTLRDRPVRVASLGRTFLDMLRRPDLCGGIHHVIDTFVEHARAYLPLIADELDRHGDPIEKVRAGYILEERCGIRDNPRIEAWTQFAQRGGSRKLDPAEAYWPEFSEKWMISLNVSR
ncbi:TPA: hypothetical protein QDB15_006406 [Burkholderia vietnamiensis]|uniref:type IV toxin-antitoxin system AbiEi family antitoxin domain-containing protein n=1 Tax=Burkholderia vietnamiensis TaxID=60552 RepID=UPI0007598C4C|nr:hypothetical protein [Burkholderia vietnamiensis]KVS13680.1 hypothetical protein WK32_31570 [Burkholderia vietnamiensis]MCA8211976.1 hypothetical protein [Burkholderia vietnamiensis]MDN7820885.1 hypothetical protein [Burkholderia vietnamiensis]HDR9102698.1 hypothetical protein [Burkholderia vietnamiensis]HDR9122514.1 hypothetical protein [Burkholderia vietnamiensis]